MLKSKVEMTKTEKLSTEEITQNSLLRIADNLVIAAKDILRKAKTEEDLRVGFEKVLEPIQVELGIKPEAKYEKSIYKSGRTDALHGQVIIEYESPKAFRHEKAVNHAYDQLIGYLQGLSQTDKESLFIFESKFIGVGFDGEKIFFVRYQGEKEQAKSKLKSEDFILIGPYPFNQNSARTLLTHLRALARLPLTAENLADKFGPESILAPKAVSAFTDSLKNWGDERVHVFFNEWKRLFGIVYGESFSGLQEKEAQALTKLYKVEKETNFQELLFSVHTYFAFLMKLIAAELLTLRESELTSSLANKLAHFSEDELQTELEDIENGGIYARRGITNFLEGDFFRWYLDAWSPRLKEALQEIALVLSEFEPATSTIAPEATRDLLKKLYQYLVPQEVRHRLGEYYTPDWLAELVLNEVNYKGDTLKRLLDPACGSGTFLVLAIQRAKQQAQKEDWPPLETAKRIVANIWGFDLNPLAVIAARTNYLFALGDLANELPNLEIPIYLTDSVLTPTRTTGNLFGEFLEVSTSVGKFQVPAEWVRDGGFLLTKAAPLVEEMVKNQYTIDEAMTRFKKEGLVFPINEEFVKNFYSQILELEKQNKNGIWARFLKNAFAPMVAGKFDFVVGNPPWIQWDYLSQEYRNATLQLWKDYGLFSLKGFQARLGGGKKDFSMLFVYASSDYYLKDGAKLGFLVTQSVFKSKGAADGFRKFQLGEKKYLKVLKVHDLLSLQPFEGATNKTAAIILKKGEKTEYPLPYILWAKKKGAGRITADKLLDEVLPILQKKRWAARPMGSDVGAWQTYYGESGEFEKIEGKASYKAILGANPDPYGVFLIEVKQVLSDTNVIIRNLTEKGRQKIKTIEEKIEPDLIHPAIRGKDIERWGAKTETYMLLVQDPETRRGYAEEFLKSQYPRTYSYLLQFKDILLKRPLYKKFHADVKASFYSQFNISKETFYLYKVIWKAIAEDIFASVVSDIKTGMGFKKLIPIQTVAFFYTNNESEAHYLCAIINSKPVRDFIKSYSPATGGRLGTPSVMEHVGIPKFDPKNKLHQKLATISKTCHRLKLENKEKEIEKLEEENDELVKLLFGIK